MNKLPQKIQVKVIKNRKTGVYLAELPDFDIFTESDSFSGLVFQVNDLIYTYFEVPEKNHGKIWYMPPQVPSLTEQQNPPVDPILFHILTSHGNNSSCLNGKI